MANRFHLFTTATFFVLATCWAPTGACQPIGNLSLSDMTPYSAINGGGPIEKDRSIGGPLAGDGKVLTLNGQTFAKGFGVHAQSEMRFRLGGTCSSFMSWLGVDDEVGSQGSVVFQVWTDGLKLFDSGVMRGDSATQLVNVSLAGRQELMLTVTDAGDGSVSDHADWAGVSISCGVSPGARFLSDLTWSTAGNSWGPPEKDMSNGAKVAGDGHTISLNGSPFSKGLGVHAHSNILYTLGGACSTFQSWIGVDDEAGTTASVVFQVWADGSKLYDSGILQKNSPARFVSTDISGRNEVTLRVTDAGDGNASDHADWADAQLICAMDVTAPTVKTVVPRANSTNVPIASAITAVFSEPMDRGSINSTTIVLVKNGTSSPVPASVTYDGRSRTAILRPIAALDLGAVYTATVKGGGPGVKDAAGNSLVADMNWILSTIFVAALKTSAPIVSTNQKGTVISGVTITNPKGTCIDISSGQNITIENSTIGPCAGAGIDVGESRNITIRNVYIHDTTDNAITLGDVDGVDITNNRIENVQTGVWALSSFRVNVSNNSFLNARGPMPRGQFVQFDKVNGPGNRIACNVGSNIFGQSAPEDAISLYNSNGVATDPILVIGNRIKGGGPSKSGGGIMLGDSGGSYQLAKDNILVDPGQYGIAVASGTNMTITSNTIYAKQQSFTNVGLSVWNQYPTPCSSVRVESNLVNWTNNVGVPNPAWNNGNCGAVAGWTNNSLSAAISPAIFDQPVATCVP